VRASESWKQEEERERRNGKEALELDVFQAIKRCRCGGSIGVSQDVEWGGWKRPGSGGQQSKDGSRWGAVTGRPGTGQSLLARWEQVPVHWVLAGEVAQEAERRGRKGVAHA